MSYKTKIKHITDVDIEDSDVLIKKPFKVNKENKRRFVRIEISAPVSMKNLQSDINNILVKDDLYSFSGTLLNLSASGVLIEVSETVSREDLVLMKFTLQDTETIDSILGVVKRIDREDGMSIVGLEFLTPNLLSDSLSQPEIELLQEHIENFNDSIHETLEKYFYKN